MARGQYDLPLNSAQPVYGPSRPPSLQTSRPTRSPSSQGPLSPQQGHPTVVVLCISGVAITRTQLVALRAKVHPGSAMQVVDNADAAIAALSRKPSAVIGLDSAISHPTFDLARSAITQFARNGGRLITESSHVNVAIPYDLANERRVEYKMKDVMPELRPDHLMT